jgi:hypothetical protein
MMSWGEEMRGGLTPEANVTVSEEAAIRERKVRLNGGTYSMGRSCVS